jgi:DNA repair exonuclease SbcCD ATPase subunit
MLKLLLEEKERELREAEELTYAQERFARHSRVHFARACDRSGSPFIRFRLCRRLEEARAMEAELREKESQLAEARALEASLREKESQLAEAAELRSMLEEKESQLAEAADLRLMLEEKERQLSEVRDLKAQLEEKELKLAEAEELKAELEEKEEKLKEAEVLRSLLEAHEAKLQETESKMQRTNLTARQHSTDLVILNLAMNVCVIVQCFKNSCGWKARLCHRRRPFRRRYLRT